MSYDVCDVVAQALEQFFHERLEAVAGMIV